LFPAQEITDNAQLFILAGFETTANTLTFAVYLLAKHPEWQERLAAAIDAALPAGPGSPITADFLASAPPLLDAVINETLRLYPVGAFTLRTAGADLQAGPYVIPKVHGLCLLSLLLILIPHDFSTAAVH